LAPAEIILEGPVSEKKRKKRRIAIKIDDNDDEGSVTSFDSGLTGMTGFTC
jgi:hypothetical protein